WDGLAVSAPQRLPQLAPVWVRAFAAARLARDEQVRVAVAVEDGTLRGVLPVVVDGGGLLRGPRLRAPADDHTKSGDALLAAARGAAVLRALVDAPCRSVPRRFSLSLFGVRDDSRTLTALDAAGLRAAVVRAADERGSRMPVTTMDDVRARLGDNFRR